MIYRISPILICLLLFTGCSAYTVDEKNMFSQKRLVDWNKRYGESKIFRLEYEPVFPNPVLSNHPFFKAISLGVIEGVPEVIRNVNIAVASSENFTEALTDTLAQSNLLQTKSSSAKYLLNVKYVDSSFRPLTWSNFLSFESISTTKIQYSLKKVSDNSSVFDRKISSVVSLHYGQGWARERKTEQFSHMSNFASLVWCLEKYDGQKFPENCSLKLHNKLVKK